MSKSQKKLSRPLAAAAVVALAVLLAACHHNDDGQAPTPVAEVPPPSGDVFVTYVSQQVATQSETDEPVPTDGLTATAPDTTEPLPVPGT